MAIIKFTNSKSTLKHIINYITQDAKTTTELITGKDCTSDNALEEMQTVKNLYNKTTGRQYIHLVQSFSPNDNLSYDREHVHNHLVINSVSFKDGKKFQQSKKDMEKYIQRDTNRNCNRYFSNRSLDTLVSLAYLFENRQYNQNKPKRTIRSFRSLSKQAKKEWIMKHKYSSSFDWFEEDEWEM